jgi:hypothetical protein
MDNLACNLYFPCFLLALLVPLTQNQQFRNNKEIEPYSHEYFIQGFPENKIQTGCLMIILFQACWGKADEDCQRLIPVLTRDPFLDGWEICCVPSVTQVYMLYV